MTLPLYQGYFYNSNYVLSFQKVIDRAITFFMTVCKDYHRPYLFLWCLYHSHAYTPSGYGGIHILATH